MLNLPTNLTEYLLENMSGIQAHNSLLFAPCLHNTTHRYKCDKIKFMRASKPRARCMHKDNAMFKKPNLMEIYPHRDGLEQRILPPEFKLKTE